MKLQEFEIILNDLLINLPFFGGKITQISLFQDYDQDLKTKILNETKSIFEFEKIIVKIKVTDNYFNDFSFIIPKNPENLFKSLINSILAFLKKQDDYGKKLGFIESTYKDDFFKAFKIKNSNYFNNYLVYATTYGLGYYCLLLSQNQFNNINKQLETFLKENNINNYKNEFSAACWVYRFKFKSLKENNINLLKNLILQF